jgi:hypothetical protein
VFYATLQPKIAGPNLNQTVPMIPPEKSASKQP